MEKLTSYFSNLNLSEEIKNYCLKALSIDPPDWEIMAICLIALIPIIMIVVKDFKAYGWRLLFNIGAISIAMKGVRLFALWVLLLMPTTLAALIVHMETVKAISWYQEHIPVAIVIAVALSALAVIRIIQKIKRLTIA